MKNLYVLDDAQVKQLTEICDMPPQPAELLPTSPVLLLRLDTTRFGTEPAARAAKLQLYMDGLRSLCEKHNALVLVIDSQDEITAADEQLMRRHGWAKVGGPLHKVGDRVYSEKHGQGEVLAMEDMAGYGWCYRLRLDSGFSTGGMVPEDKLKAVVR